MEASVTAHEKEKQKDKTSNSALYHTDRCGSCCLDYMGLMVSEASISSDRLFLKLW